MFKGNYRNTRIRCEICSKLTIKTISTVNFEQVNAGWEGDGSEYVQSGFHCRVTDLAN